MTNNELKKKYMDLYNYMSVSNNTEYMQLFGRVMTEMMDWFIANKPDAAESWIEKLCAIKWKQYLSRSEAMQVVTMMQPKAAWGFDAWLKAMEDLSLEHERDGVFNKYALWVVMNAEHSDDGADIASLLNISPSDVTNAEYIKTVWKFAMNRLLDQDGVYSVREYFLK